MEAALKSLIVLFSREWVLRQLLQDVGFGKTITSDIWESATLFGPKGYVLALKVCTQVTPKATYIVWSSKPPKQ